MKKNVVLISILLIPVLLSCMGCADMMQYAQRFGAQDVPGQISDRDVSGNSVIGKDVSGNAVSENDASAGAHSGKTVSETTVSGNNAEEGKKQTEKEPSQDKTKSLQKMDAASLRSWVKGTWQSGSGITLIVEETSATVRGYKGYGDIVFTGTLSVDEKTQTCSFTGTATGVAGISGSFVNADLKMQRAGETEMDGTASVGGGYRVGFINYQADTETVTFHAKKQ